MNNKNKISEKLKNEEIITEQSQTLSLFLREKGKELQEKIGIDDKTLYPQEKIAEKLNISVDQLHQKIYGKKPLTRDWLIAICAAYGLDDCDTSRALSICDMPTLDDASRREEFIVYFLRINKNKSVGVEDFNKALQAAKLPILDISFRKKKDPKNLKKTISPYTEYQPKVIRTYEEEDDPYNSLETIYYPRNRCVAAAFLKDKENRKYLLEAFSNGTFCVHQDGELSSSHFESLDPSNPFYMYFSELAAKVHKEKQRLDDICNDSKNYRNRISANIKNDRIHIFCEEFNYDMPERNEYFLMEYIDGHYTLSIANKSMFMQEYMSEKDYYAHYHTNERIHRKTYYSIEEIEKHFKDSKSYFYPNLVNVRKNAFKRLKKKVTEELDNIRNKKIYIRDSSSIWDNHYNVLQYYMLEKEFECTYDPEYGDIKSAKDSVDFTVGSGDVVTITLSDLTSAFEFGLDSISDICRIKLLTGSIESVLS